MSKKIVVEEIFKCPEGTPKRVDKILAQAFPEKSRALIQKAIEQKKVRRVDGSSLESKTKIYSGDELIIDLERQETYSLMPKNIPLNILYEDDEILVINKASGMVVHPGDGTGDDTLVHSLLYHYPKGLCPVGAPKRPGIVHRLDKETSGVMVVAKLESAHHFLVEQFAQRKTDKEYHALVQGFFSTIKGKIDQPIGRHPKNRVKMAVLEHGKPALTEWETINQFDQRFTLLRVKIHTGRTHQIRVHFSYLGHPLAGDSTYGAQKHASFNRVMLHAYSLSFMHPSSHEKLTFYAEPPSDFQSSLNDIN
ncbi:MAG: RluA family pseudouridine synthase [Opitutae bacterium]|jgi:23S rRNA pseudouridine1911/1915/1917 synthase|nr:RluA family pseudouridine synthase [Opitutae bacterium]